MQLLVNVKVASRKKIDHRTEDIVLANHNGRILNIYMCIYIDCLFIRYFCSPYCNY